jgi:LCP family protein required for cell wall assembly
MTDERDERRRPERPEYRVYRSRRRLLDRLRPPRDLGRLGGLRDLRRPRKRAPEEPRVPGRRPQIDWKRVLKWIGVAVGAWLLLSLVLFFVSSQLEQSATERAERALSGGGNLVTGSTVLVLGSDERSKETAEPGSGGPGRADSVMLLRVGVGSVRKLSILRDSYSEIPGHLPQKINAAYAIGGTALMIETVEQFMGNDLRINHVVEINFEDFPELIDALGGIDVDVQRRICAPPFGNFPRGIRLGKGDHHLNGRRALGFARVRKNPCNPEEDDRARAKRQQQVLGAIRSRLLSPVTFFRLPWVSWQAPKTVRTDMAGPNLFALFGDLVTGGAGKTRVLEPTCLGCGPGSSAVVSPEAKRREVRRLLGD